MSFKEEYNDAKIEIEAALSRASSELALAMQIADQYGLSFDFNEGTGTYHGPITYDLALKIVESNMLEENDDLDEYNIKNRVKRVLEVVGDEDDYQYDWKSSFC